MSTTAIAPHQIRQYTPPAGFEDFPFTYIYAADALTDGQNAANQFVYIEGGLGDFILRRIVGLNNVLNPSGGQFQMEDDFLRFVQSDPMYVQGGSELPIIPELRYREKGAIRFNLFDVLRSFADPWIQQQSFSPADATQTGFGQSEAFDGTNLVFGYPATGGSEGAYVFNFASATGTWTQTQKLTPSGSSGVANQFGVAVALIGGNTIAVGSSSEHTGDGAVYIYTLSGGVWSQLQRISSPNPLDAGQMGSQLCFINATTLAVSALQTTVGGLTQAGKVYIFTLSGGTWSLSQTLTATVPIMRAFFGASLATDGSGTNLLIGAPVNTGSATGNAYLFTLSGGVWSQTAIFTPGAGQPFYAGNSVSMYPGLIIVGAPSDGAVNSGGVYVYTGSGATWALSQLILGSAQGSSAMLGFGYTVNLVSPTTMMVYSNSIGSIFVFNLISGTWTLGQQFGANGQVETSGFGSVIASTPNNANLVAIANPTSIDTGYLFAFTSIYTSQLAFQGVRRVPIKPRKPVQKFKPKTFTYILQTTLTSLGVIGNQLTGAIPLIQKISDYDFELYELQVTYQGAAGPIVQTKPLTRLWLYDQNKQQLSNLPVLDLYYNGAPQSPFKNGAINPALLYEQESTMRIDVFNLIGNAALLPVTMSIHLIGRQRYPCGV